MPEEPPADVTVGAVGNYKGTIQKVIYSKNGFGVYVLLTDTKHTLKFAGAVPPVEEYDTVEVSGKWEHNKYGLTLKAHRVTISIPYDTEGIRVYLEKHVEQIGPELSAAIVGHFGLSTIEVLNKDPERVVEVDGIGPARARNIISSWESGEEDRNTYSYLYSLGIPPHAVTKALSTWGKNVRTVIQQNPYRLMELDRVGFKIADRAALSEGVGWADPRRIVAGTIHVFEAQWGAGHCCRELGTVIDDVSDLLEVTDTDVILDAVVSSVGSETGFLSAEEFNGKLHIYTREIIHFERSVASSLLRISKLMERPMDYREVIDTVTNSLEDITLSDEQMAAISASLKERALVITGGPGTGKTTIVRGIISGFTAFGATVVLCAPTGRAAKRAEEASGHPASTIHRALGFDPINGTWGVNHTNPLQEGTVVIVDEVSMLDIQLAHRICDALPKSGQLILVGDVDQLPSVGPGNVLRDIIDSKVITTIRLTKVFRQAETSMIITNAHRINHGISPDFDAGAGQRQDMFWRQCSSGQEIQRSLLSYIRTLSEEGTSVKEDVQVITPMHKGDIGTLALNTLLQEELNTHGLIVYQGRGYVLRTGDKVLHDRNNYDLFVFNGEIGNIVDPDDYGGETYLLSSPLGGKLEREKEKVVLWVKFPDRDLPLPYTDAWVLNLRLAYCITIHKCVAPNTLTESEYGLLPVSNLPETGTIATPTSARIYGDLVRNPIGKALQIRTQGGYELIATPEHGMDVWTGDKHERREAGSLLVGDSLRLGMGVRIDPDQPAELPPAQATDVRAVEHHIPSHMTGDLAELLGLLVADGTLYHAGFRLAKRHQEVVDRFMELCQLVFGVSAHRTSILGTPAAEVNSTQLACWLKSLGGLSPHEKAVPLAVLRSPEVYHRRFLRGLFEDGSVHQRTGREVVDHIELSTSRACIEQAVRVMLLRAGIPTGTLSGDHRQRHIYIYGPFIRLFAESIGFIAQGKQEMAMWPHGDSRYTVPLSDHEARELRSLHGHQIGRYSANNAVERHSITRAVLEKLPNTTALADGIHHRARMFHYDKVASIEAVDSPSMCVSVPEGHRFLQNGFCGWNSQGSEYPIVVIPLHMSNRIMLTRNLLYTALTRGRKEVFLLGDQDALRTAVRTNRQAARNTFLKERLQGLM